MKRREIRLQYELLGQANVYFKGDSRFAADLVPLFGIFRNLDRVSSSLYFYTMICHGWYLVNL